MYVCVVCVRERERVLARTRTHICIHSSLCLSFSVYIVCHFVCVYLFLVYAYDML
jgi:hypothetical protein